MSKIILIIILTFISLFGEIFSTTQLEKRQNLCGGNSLFNITYIMEDNQTKYKWGFYLFGDEKMDTRNLIPNTREITIPNGTVLLDSCKICMPFFQYDSVVNLHKYIFEIRKPNGNQETIALEYGTTTKKDTTVGSTLHGRAAFSYFIDLALTDTLASQYTPQEISQIHIFSDGYYNTLYELHYQGNVVGIKYFSAHNNQEYIRYFIPKS